MEAYAPVWTVFICTKEVLFRLSHVECANIQYCVLQRHPVSHKNKISFFPMSDPMIPFFLLSVCHVRSEPPSG